MPIKSQFLVVFLLLALSLLSQSSCKQTSNQVYKLNVLDMDGNEVSLATLAGQPVVVNFWATWCGPCRQEKPELEKARQALEPEGVKFICLSDEAIPTIQAYRRQKPDGITYYKLKNSVKWLGVFEIPQTLLINAKGEVVNTHTGYNDWSSPDVVNQLRTALQ